MIIYCLTGSIATGKTTVSNILEEKGLIIIDTDKIVHQIYKTEKLISLIKNSFGDIYIKDNRIDRKKLGELVFNKKEELEKLNLLVHPLVKDEVFRTLKIYIEKEKELNKNFFVVFVIPLYFETGRTYKVDKTILAYCPKDIQINRLINREQISKEEAIKRINSQIDIESKIIESDIIINTNQDLLLLKKDLEKILENINYDKYK